VESGAARRQAERPEGIRRLREPVEVLLVADAADATELLADALQAEGYRVRTAGDGQNGLFCLDEALPSVIVLDVEMPRLNGPGMALQMFLTDAGRERIPIILCSGILNLAGIALQVGTPYFLAKPYTLDAMMKLVAQVVVERTPPTHRPANP
jgi:DNA-binding NtrC family response regulator